MKKRTRVIGALAVVLCVSVLANAEEGRTAAVSGRDAEWILQMFDDSKLATKLSPEEEREHEQRIRRLYDLQKESLRTPAEIREPAGAAPPAFAAAPSPESQPAERQGVAAAAAPSGQAAERLIEAVEALQMEIRQLRVDLARQKKQAASKAAEGTLEDNNATEQPSTENPEK